MEVFGENREDAGQFAQRFALDPLHQGDEAVVAPLRCRFKYGRKPSRSREGRTRQIVCWENPFAGCFVPDHFGDIGPEIAASRTIELHHLERGSDPSRTETRNDPVLPAAKVHNLIFGPESGGGTTPTGGSPNRADNEPQSSSNVVRSAHNYLYRCRHYLLAPGGPGDVHNSLTSQFQRRAQKRGVYVSERQAGRIVAYWVNFWVRLMRQDQVPLGLRFTNAEKARGNRRSARSRGQHKDKLSYRAHVLDRAGLDRAQIAAILDRGQRTIRAYLASPFDTVQAQRQRLARPRPRPRLHVPAAAAICYLLMPPTVKESSEKEVPTDSKLPQHTDIDPIAELKKHWAAQDRQKSHKAPSRAPAKPTPERKIAYQP